MAIPKRVTEFARSFTEHLFKDMNNAEYRGANFTWDGFPAMAGRLASAHLFMSYPKFGDISEKRQKQLELMVTLESERIAKELLKTLPPNLV